MYTSILIVFFLFLMIGIGVNFFLFSQEKQSKKSTRFITSERLLVFIIEILIAVIGFGITLAITNANEQQVEKDRAIRMLEQTIEYTDKQIANERSYLKMHNRGEITSEGLLVSNIINLDYYNNILSNEVILQNANMNTYGDIMRYLIWVENRDERAKEAEDDTKIYSHMYRRYLYLQKVRDLLVVCCDELSGKITAEEAAERCKEIKKDQENSNQSTALAPASSCLFALDCI